MYSKLEYPTYFLEVYLCQAERDSLLKNGSLNGTLDMLLRVFPAFNCGEEKFITINGTLQIILGCEFSILKNDNKVILNINKTCIGKDYFNCNYGLKSFGKVYFNMI